MTEPPSKPAVNVSLWSRARELFDEAHALSASERTRLLDARCADDPALRQAVESLLKADDDLPHTRDDPLLRGVGAALGKLMPVVEPGRRFGAFAVVEEIGRGGMGVVYLAERHDGKVSQRVALKLVAHGHLDAEASARLARERRLLAALEHPNIARLIDAGEDSSGIPWFAMEYVRGEPITAYCDRKQLPLAERLRLFREVCAAVQHAHANLIVHCDLKDGNILITEGGMPKLLDFGIATTLDATVPDADRESRFLSPQTAAPEQFLGQPSGVATDVYALGVLLCELVAGRRPFEADADDPQSLRRRVLNDPPLLPSRAVTDDAATRRGTSAASLRRRLSGDIDAIAARALGKTPQQRYASVEQLDRDVARHLALQPVDVRRDERGYRLARFLRRNALAASFALVLGALVIGFGAVTLRQNQRLVLERERAQQVTNFMVGLFQASMPERARGHEVTARELLQRGRQQLHDNLNEQPALKAAMLAAIAEASFAIDDLDGAEQAAKEALDLRESSAAPDGERVASLTQLATFVNRRGRSADAMALIDRAEALSVPDVEARLALLDARATAFGGLGKSQEELSLRREIHAQRSTLSGADDPRTLRAAIKLADALKVLGHVDEFERVLSDALPRERRNLAPDDPVVGQTLMNLARLANNRRDFVRAEALASEALEIYRKIYGDKATQTATAMNTLGIVAQSSGDYARALAMYEAALGIQRSVQGEESTQVAAAEYNVGLLLVARMRQPSEALPHLQRAVDIAVKVHPAGHVNIAIFRLALGASLRGVGRLDDAEATLQAALARFLEKPAPRGLNIAIARGELACIALLRGLPGAREQYDAAVANADRIEPEDGQVLNLHDCTRR